MAESTPPAIFTSVLLTRIEALRQAKASAAQWIGTIANLVQRGVKVEEVAWCGVLDWLKAHGTAAITRDELAAYVRAATPRVTEWTKGADRWEDRVEIRRDQGGARAVFRDGALWACGFASDAARNRWLEWATAPDYSHPKYRLPGGTNYRELLLLWPQARGVFDPAKVAIRQHEDAASYPPKTSIWYDGICIGRCDDPPLADYDGEIRRAPDDHWRKVVAPELFERGEAYDGAPRQPLSGAYRSPHFWELNVLAHIRFDDRNGPGGRRVLHIEEIQSDWHAAGRRFGYRKPGMAYESMLAELGPAWKDTWPGCEKTDARPPDAPFKKSWAQLAFRRMLRYAADNDYAMLSWPTGATIMQRFAPHGSQALLHLYDRVLPRIARKLAAPFGGGYCQTALAPEPCATVWEFCESHLGKSRCDVQPAEMSAVMRAYQRSRRADGSGIVVHGFDLPPGLREAVTRGLPLF